MRADAGAASIAKRRALAAARAVLPPVMASCLVIGGLEALKRLGALPITVPAPSAVAEAVLRSGGDLLYHAQPTVVAAATGFVLAAVAALVLGSIAVTWRAVEPGILRFAVLLDSMPLIALTPILMVWVGNGLAPRIILATIAALFPMIVAVVSGLKAVDQTMAELFHILAANRWQRWRKLALPSALPYVFAGLKIAAPLALLGALIAEWISADRGLGIMMIYALFSFDVPLAWLTIVAVCLLAMLAYGIVAAAERVTIGASDRDLGGLGSRGRG